MTTFNTTEPKKELDYHAADAIFYAHRAARYFREYLKAMEEGDLRWAAEAQTMANEDYEFALSERLWLID